MGIDTKRLDAALDDAFSEPGPENPRKTRAVVVIYDGRLIVIPSRKLVLVRFGAITDRKAWNTDAFIKDILECLPS